MLRKDREYITGADVWARAGFKPPMGRDDLDRMGLKYELDGRLIFVEKKHAEAFIALVERQRADGRQLRFGFYGPPPGKSNAARLKERHARAAKATVVTVPAVPIEEPAPAPDALGRAQLLAIQSNIDRLEMRLASIDAAIAAICRELGIRVE